MSFYESTNHPSEGETWSNYFNVDLPCVMEIVELSARDLMERTKLAQEGRLQVIRKRDYKRYRFFDGDRKWYMEQSEEGVITLIVDEAMFDAAAAMVAVSASTRG